MEMVDASIWREDGLIEAHVKEYFGIARMCTSEIRRDRPTMAKVFQLLNRISIWIYTAFYECYNVIKIDIRNKMEEEYFYDCYVVIY